MTDHHPGRASPPRPRLHGPSLVAGRIRPEPVLRGASKRAAGLPGEAISGLAAGSRRWKRSCFVAAPVGASEHRLDEAGELRPGDVPLESRNAIIRDERH